jgi:hypothetical protein
MFKSVKVKKTINYLHRIFLSTEISGFFVKTSKITGTVFSFVLICNFSFAQKQTNNWLFGNGGGVNFNTVSALPLNPVYQDGGNIASISDTAGNLLFYTDGETVWTKANTIMENGSGLYGYRKSPEPSIIVPFSETSNNHLYYIFTTDGGECLHDSVFAYSVVDMHYNNGLGKVITKNSILFKPSFQIVAATKHENNRDTWVLAHMYNSDLFYAYLVTPCGIHGPVITKIGLRHEYLNSTLKFSPDGSKIAINLNGYNHLSIFDFDKSNGFISNFKDLGMGSGGYGCCFSPDSRFLYITNGAYVKQYDALAGNAADINASGIIIANSIINENDYALSNASDGSIYSMKPGSDYLAKIKYPNKQGALSEYIPHSLLYPNVQNNAAGLPNFIESYFDSSWIAVQQKKINFSYERVCVGDSTPFHMINQNAYPIKWIFGDVALHNESVSSNPKHLYIHPGAYQVKLINYVTCVPDTIIKTIIVDSIPSIDIGADKYLCEGNQVKLEVNEGYTAYYWMGQAGGTSYTVTEAGEYYVQVKNICGEDSDTILVKAYTINIPNLITPNGDQKNDFFSIEGLYGSKGELNIYNSWGSRIYFNKSYDNSWCAEDLDKGIYYYDFKFDMCPLQKGWVQVIK